MKNNHNHNSVEAAREAFASAAEAFNNVCACKGAGAELKRETFAAMVNAYEGVIKEELAREKAIRDGIAADAAEEKAAEKAMAYCEMCDTEYSW